MKSRNIVFAVVIALSGFILFSFVNWFPVQQKAVVAMDKVHIVYLNFDNPVTVIVPGVPKEKVVVKSPELEIKSLGDSKYAIPVMDPILSNKKIHLNVFILNSAGKEQLVQTIDYLVITAPEPQPYFAGFKGGKISASDLNQSDSIYIEIPGFYYEGFRYKVSRFTMVHIDTTGMSMTLPQETGWMLSPEQKLKMSLLSKGDKIIISDIFATYTDPITKKPGNEIRIPKSMEFVIE
jgi:hypothetical protein